MCGLLLVSYLLWLCYFGFEFTLTLDTQHSIVFVHLIAFIFFIFIFFYFVYSIQGVRSALGSRSFICDSRLGGVDDVVWYIVLCHIDLVLGNRKRCEYSFLISIFVFHLGT